MLYSTYHMTLKLIQNRILGVKMSRFIVIFYATL